MSPTNNTEVGLQYNYIKSITNKTDHTVEETIWSVKQLNKQLNYYKLCD